MRSRTSLLSTVVVTCAATSMTMGDGGSIPICASCCAEAAFTPPTYGDGYCTGSANWCESGFPCTGAGKCFDSVSPRFQECYSSSDIITGPCGLGFLEYGGKTYVRISSSNNGSDVCCFYEESSRTTSRGPTIIATPGSTNTCNGGGGGGWE